MPRASAFKSGNATILRGGKEAAAFEPIIAQTMVGAAQKQLAGFPVNAIQLVAHSLIAMPSRPCFRSLNTSTYVCHAGARA